MALRNIIFRRNNMGIDLFGVSADWISGRSNIPYEESIISYLENNLFSISTDINLQHNVDLIYYLYIVHIILGFNYFKSTKKQLSLQQRANVIYALHFGCVKNFV